MTRKKIVVIGAGPGGLAAAMLLARFDADVTVIERQAHVGGRTASIRADGFTFDTGPTFFLYPEPLREIFHLCGFDLDREVDLIRLDPQYRLQFEDGTRLDATPDIEQMEAQIAAIAPADALRFRAFLTESRRKLIAFRPAFRRAFEGPTDLLAPEIRRALPLLAPWRSVDQELQRYFADPRIRIAFSFQSKYLGMSPFKCPSLFTILSFLEYEYGVFHPRGGCGAVMTAMADVAERMGVKLRLGEPVEEILIEAGRAVGVRTQTGSIGADAIVLNADFAQAMTTLVPDRQRRKWRDRKIEKARYSCSTFMMYLGIEGRIDALPHHTIYLTDDYRQNLTEIEAGKVLSRNPSLYVQNATPTDPSLAPRGCSTLYVLVPVPHRSAEISWDDVPGYRARVLAQLTKLGVPDLENRIRIERIVTPHDWESEQNIFRGATFSLRHSMDQMLHNRPHNRFEDIDGVYLVGGGTHPGSGLPVIFQSALISTGLMEQDMVLEPRPFRRAAPRAAVMSEGMGAK
jgi:phytoene desaturase